MVTARAAEELDAMRDQKRFAMQAGERPDAAGMGAESAEYVDASLDPQWMWAWKMFPDQAGEYGVRVPVPVGQYFGTTTSHLQNLRRPDGRPWFQLVTPARTQAEGKYACFVGECKKLLHRRIQVVSHVRAFHFEEAAAHAVILTRIEQQVAQDDPRLKALLASLDEPEGIAPLENLSVACEVCNEQSPADHPNPEKWLRGHTMGAHKEGANGSA